LIFIDLLPNVRAGICFEPAAEDKQMIEKPIQVFERLGVDRLGLCQR
jgi:hypothetical protein